ncbi:class I SAM-dependent methyltransferase [Porticoccus sp.]|uniref:class I SAM-dependent methyltransferase n=1 Tax=Porticoccus sp. TaxID=2024853 RepID=UPI003F69B3B2
MQTLNPLLLLVLWLGCIDLLAAASPFSGEHRTPEFVARDNYRHPAETLAFFEVEPGMTVVEISPGAGWYTEILAPLVQNGGANRGRLYAAHFPSDSGVPYYEQSLAKFTAKLAAYPSLYGDVTLTTFDPANAVLAVPEGVADRVLTFRNVHNWLRSDSEEKAFELFFRALKPGGVLGVVEHRSRRAIDRAEMIRSGYMPEAYVIELAEKAGFVLAARSEVNANPRDTADHPEDVWTLPPTLRLQDRDREKYQAIGESDRMTLKFVKPATP